jgi:hypothetical protein
VCKNKKVSLNKGNFLKIFPKIKETFVSNTIKHPVSQVLADLQSAGLEPGDL